MSDLQLSLLITSFSIVITDMRVACLEGRVQMLVTEDPERFEKLKEKVEAMKKVDKYNRVLFGALIAVTLYLRHRSR